METDVFKFIDPTKLKPLVEVDDLQGKIGESVEVEGAIHSIRNLRKVAFVIIRTARDQIQVVLFGDGKAQVDALTEGDFVRVSGEVLANNSAYKGIELAPSSIERLSGPTEPLPTKLGVPELDLPIDKKLDQRLLTLRHLKERAVFKLQEGISRSFRDFLMGQGFTEIHSPKLVGANAEGGANVFNLDYFGSPAFLAQSPQFYKQFMVPVFGRVFEVAPVFRAEAHKTSRHVNEYTSMDFEMGPIDSFRDIMSMEAGFLRYMMEVLRKDYTHELDLLEVDLPEVDRIPEIPFASAKDLVAERFGREYRDPNDLEPEEERLISQVVKEETGSDFVFVTGYPVAKRPFYTMPSEDDPSVTNSFDLLFRGLEITTGGQRIHDYEMQVEALRRKGMNPDLFGQFLQLHQLGTPPHGGLGIGLERLTMRLLGRDNIRDAVLFPRDLKRLEP